jgi:hypothetical protein
MWRNMTLYRMSPTTQGAWPLSRRHPHCRPLPEGDDEEPLGDGNSALPVIFPPLVTSTMARGSRTANVLPCPGPGLSAVTCPPCILQVA